MAVRAPERVEAVLASALNLARWATGGRFQAAGLGFAHAPLAPREAYAALLGLPVAFDAARDSLDFDADQLAWPLVGANAELRAHLRALTARTLAALGRSSLAASVQRQVRAEPGWGRERVAAAIDLSAARARRAGHPPDAGPRRAGAIRPRRAVAAGGTARRRGLCGRPGAGGRLRALGAPLLARAAGRRAAAGLRRHPAQDRSGLARACSRCST